MSKLKFYALFVFWLLQACSEKDPFKEEFREKIIKSFPSVKEFSFLDQKKIVYTDTAFKMPEPVYKAMVINAEAPSDSILFYYYHAKDIQNVFRLNATEEEFTLGTNLFDCGNYLADSTNGDFLVYFRNCRSLPEPDLSFLEVSYLDSSLAANFGFQSPKVTVEKVKMEVVEPEPPPPPPPPKPKNKKAAQ
jgi:hypothetical protein